MISFKCIEVHEPYSVSLVGDKSLLIAAGLILIGQTRCPIRKNVITMQCIRRWPKMHLLMFFKTNISEDFAYTQERKTNLRTLMKSH